ncbi:protein EURL homolog [Scomber japonicus]|uniref:protein EURL homolog n=1 Tax=Scomber japonicus TaxID=13676 RepID=UPI002306BA2F|nr:protein EURL homolog [Scomber japonicus]XP_053187980.1 protein EURL homolog [Scomber japonicus]
MDEEEQFVNIDLNDDNICSVCKLETETGTLSFCHVCFELSIEGVSSATLLHSKSLRGHRDCFEKYHLIANQKLSRSKVSRSAYEGMKLALSQKLNRIIQYAQNKDSVSPNGPSRRGAKLLCYNQQSDCKLLPQSDAQVPRYAPRWDTGKAARLPDYTMGMLECHTVEELGLLQESQGDVWSSDGRTGLHKRNQSSGGQTQHRHQGHSRDELTKMSVDELHQLNAQLLMQIQKVFEELTVAVQEKDSLASELHVRHIAIEQLFKNCAKLPWLHISRAGVKASSNGGGGGGGGSSPVE